MIPRERSDLMTTTYDLALTRPAVVMNAMASTLFAATIITAFPVWYGTLFGILGEPNWSGWAVLFIGSAAYLYLGEKLRIIDSSINTRCMIGGMVGGLAMVIFAFIVSFAIHLGYLLFLVMSLCVRFAAWLVGVLF